MILFLQCIRVPGTFLLDYIPSLEPILEKTLHMASKDGYNLGCSILRNIFRALTLTFPIEYRAIPEGYDRPLKDYLSIKVRNYWTVFPSFTTWENTSWLFFVFCLCRTGASRETSTT